MKIFTLIFLALALVAVRGTEVNVRVVDDDLHPISGASTLIGFAMVKQNSDEEYKGATDPNGSFSARGRAEYSVYVRASTPERYDAWLRNLSNEQDLSLTVVLRRIIHPIPLFALRSSIGSVDPEKPQQSMKLDESYGFDFEMGDLVVPYGKGKMADILLRIRNEFRGWKWSDTEIARTRELPINRGMSEEKFRYWNGKWDGELEITFPGEKEGLREENDRFLAYSGLKMPHSAPAEGYVPTKRYTGDTYTPPANGWDVVHNGYFLRTRVKLDKNGNIVSANYAKIMGEFQFDARGGVSFTYYFNPTPNDRNLEFDPKRNLFPENFPDAQVFDP